LPGMEVSVLFPKGLVTPTQEHQLTCWGDNVRSFRVRGTFDDCQRMVKAAFMDAQLNQRFELSSANSINLGRLLPQAVYYAAASLKGWLEHGERVSFVVPSGNLGNSVAGLWARRLGMPIGEFVLAHNLNRTVPDLLESGKFIPRASIPTLASAMDVGNPSNLERLCSLYPDINELRATISADVVTDAQIRARIRSGFGEYGQIWCPHTATAAEVYARLPAPRRQQGRWLLVATAHPAKFREIVEPLIGRSVTVPASLARLFELPAKALEIAADLDALRQGMNQGLN
jgi:threonine synthase